MKRWISWVLETAFVAGFVGFRIVFAALLLLWCLWRTIEQSLLRVFSGAERADAFGAETDQMLRGLSRIIPEADDY